MSAAGLDRGSAARVSMFNNVMAKVNAQTDVCAILEGIRTGRWRGPVEQVRAAYAQGGKDAAKPIKERLPAVTFSGSFDGPHKAEALATHSGMLCLDLDGLNGRLEEVRRGLASDPHCFALFTSPSGAGLKVLIRIPPDGATHGRAFDTAAEYFARVHNVDVDPACRDVCRLCFVSHDPELIHNPDAALFEIPPEPKPAALPAAPERPIAAKQSARTDDSPDRVKVEDALKHVSADCSFDDWLRVGMALHSWHPAAGRAIWDSWSATAPQRYEASAIGEHWHTFTDKPGGVTIASLFKMAIDGGWNPRAGNDTAASKYGPALIGDGERQTINQAHFAARYVNDSGAVHDPTVRRFYVYDPSTGLWKHQTDEATTREIGLCFQVIVNEQDCPHFLAKRTASHLQGLRELARGIAERRDVFNQRRDVIHVGNGMLELDATGTVKLKPFSPDYYSRNRSEIAWNPNADCPRFKRELLLSAMDEADVRLIQRYAGQCIMGVNVSQTFLVMRGTPGAGKSTLANIIENVIGRHNVTELRIQQLCERFEMIRFVGRTILSGKDVPGDFLNMRSAHVLKALVGGDTLEGEVKFGNESFSLDCRFNVLISTNTRLRVKLDSDAGAWRRRMLIVDYARPKPTKPIPGFDAILLRDEGEGILRWAVEGAIMLKRELDATGSIQLTDTQRRRVDDLLSESDSVRSFVRECVVSAHRAEVTIHDLTAGYRDYCDARDWEPLRDKQFQSELPDAMLEFYRAIKANDIQRNGKSVRGFRGVRLQTTPDRASEASEPAENGPELPFPDGSYACPEPSAYNREHEQRVVDDIYNKGLEHAYEASELTADTTPEAVNRAPDLIAVTPPSPDDWQATFDAIDNTKEYEP